MSDLFGNHIVGFSTRRLTCSHFHGRTIHHGTNGIISVNHVRVNQALSFIIGHDRIRRLSVCLLIKFQTNIWHRMFWYLLHGHYEKIFSPVKTENFHDIIFAIFAQNIDCGYT